MATQTLKPPMVRRWASLDEGADYFGVSTKTFRRYIADGLVSAYRAPRGRLIRIDLNELDSAMSPIPAAGGGR